MFGRTLIFNDIIDSGIPLFFWKTAVILPIRKPGKPAHHIFSFRPIALTSVLYKVFERIILRPLLAWEGQQGLFHPDHFGFLPHRDTTLALATFLNDIHKARLQKHHSIAVCLDIKSAYCYEFVNIVCKRL